MRFSRFATILAVVALAVGMLMAQAPPATGNQPGSSPTSIIHVLAPQEGQKLAQSFVSVQYELQNPGAIPTAPNFVVRVDNQDPVQTTSTSATFTGLQPGQHTATVQLVDANGTPIAGAAVTVHFVTVQPQTMGVMLPIAGKLIPASFAIDQPLQHSVNALPLLSIIGFGVLIGGIVSAMKTR
jgi:hypothetical protein